MNFNFKKLVITSRDPDQLYMLFEKTCYLFYARGSILTLKKTRSCRWGFF